MVVALAQPVLAGFVGNSTWFGVLISIHVVGAVLGLGPTFSFGILAALGKKATPEGGMALLEGVLAVDERIVNPILLTTQPLTGVLLIFNRGLNHDFFSGHRLWLMAGILAYLTATVLALSVMDPTIKKMIQLGRSGQGGTPSFGALAARADKVGPILALLGVFIVVMMAWKPGSGCGAAFRC